MKTLKAFDYPLHLGSQNQEHYFPEQLKVQQDLGAILSKGIGNTMRISLSADPVEEVKVARELT